MNPVSEYVTYIDRQYIGHAALAPTSLTPYLVFSATNFATTTCIPYYTLRQDYTCYTEGFSSYHIEYNWGLSEDLATCDTSTKIMLTASLPYF